MRYINSRFTYLLTYLLNRVHSLQPVRYDQNHSTYLFICDSAGIMFWGDGKLDKIESAYLNGTGRKVLLRETNVDYFAFSVHGGNIYFTDRNNVYVD